MNFLDSIRGALNGVESLLTLSSGNFVGSLDLTRHLDEAISKIIRGAHGSVERIFHIVKGCVLDIPNMDIVYLIPVIRVILRPCSSYVIDSSGVRPAAFIAMCLLVVESIAVVVVVASKHIIEFIGTIVVLIIVAWS